MLEPTNLNRRHFLRTAGMMIGASQFGAMAFAKTRSELYPLDRATTWLNSPRLTDATLQGKVTLVEFWTYSCINWRRQLPFVRAWAQKYKDQGLVVVGVHSPEFSFEKNEESELIETGNRSTARDWLEVTIAASARLATRIDAAAWPKVSYCLD